MPVKVIVPKGKLRKIDFQRLSSVLEYISKPMSIQLMGTDKPSD